MEPIIVYTIVGFVIAFAITFIIYGRWERKYVATHFTFEKEVSVIKKSLLSSGEKHSSNDYFIDAEVDGKKLSLQISKAIYEKIEDGKTYNMVICRSKVLELKS